MNGCVWGYQRKVVHIRRSHGNMKNVICDKHNKFAVKPLLLMYFHFAAYVTINKGSGHYW